MLFSRMAEFKSSMMTIEDNPFYTYKWYYSSFFWQSFFFNLCTVKHRHNSSSNYIYCMNAKVKARVVQFSPVQSLSHVRLFATPWIAARQAFLSITNSQSSLNSRPLSQWCHPAISSLVVPSSCPQSLPGSGCFIHLTQRMYTFHSR